MRYFRNLIIALLLGLALFTLLQTFAPLPLLVSALAGVALFIVLIIVPSIRYFDLMGRNLHSEPIEAPRKPLKKPTMREKRPTYKSNLEASHPMFSERTEKPPRSPIKPKMPAELGTLDEILSEGQNNEFHDEDRNDFDVELTQAISREREISEATAHIDDALTDFDQSIAEAEYEAGLSARTRINVFAKPSDQTKRSDKSLYSEYEFDDADEDPKVVQLQNENVSLKNRQESLKVELAKLQIDIRNKNELIEKSESEKNRALKLKDQAIEIANKERKQRKLTETKARQLISQLKQDTLNLDTGISADRV